MDFDEYQEKSHKTSMNTNIGAPHIYPILGLGGEVGELMNKVKKIHRDKSGKIDEKTKEDISGELGDILWYVAEVATQFGLKLNKVAQGNVDKLAKRQQENKLHGSGDNR